MSSLPPDKTSEFTASDILSADAWNGRTPKPVLGLDVACTKIAVDFQNMRRPALDETIRRNLELLREAVQCDCAFAAVYDPEEAASIQDIQVARSAFAQCRPEALRGESRRQVSLAERPFGAPASLGAARHLGAAPRADGGGAAVLGAADRLRAASSPSACRASPAGFLGLAHDLPRGAWDVNLQLMLKLIGTSLATGLERIRIEARLAKLEERTTLSQAGGERRPVGLRRREQRGVLLAALEGHARLRR